MVLACLFYCHDTLCYIVVDIMLSSDGADFEYVMPSSSSVHKVVRETSPVGSDIVRVERRVIRKTDTHTAEEEEEEEE